PGNIPQPSGCAKPYIWQALHHAKRGGRASRTSHRVSGLVQLYWIKFFIRWHGRDGPMRHPREMGATEVEAFLTMLATERRVSTSTHNQALSAL
ncbi:MAG: site-specific integrase, partial [Hydrogenophaga sp.]|nr:site-specific integrase [Hydrogenophaga sp.]